MNSNRRIVLVVVILAIAIAGVTSALYALSLNTATNSSTALPAGCTKPADGFLVVASNDGYNDSRSHGAPNATWPKITVKEGTTVNITVCNTDIQTHSFQISHYEDGASNTLVPGQVLHFTFVANQAGTFNIFCQVFCSIHIYMQSGQLVVSQ
jgi:heme/copper-type cytochrome/quinol oxidase subunit 2